MPQSQMDCEVFASLNGNARRTKAKAGRSLGGLCNRSIHRFLSTLERICDAFPISVSVANGIIDELAAPLEVAVSHRGVQVERSILDVLVQSHILRALVNPARRCASYIGTERSNEK